MPEKGVEKRVASIRGIGILKLSDFARWIISSFFKYLVILFTA